MFVVSLFLDRIRAHLDVFEPPFDHHSPDLIHASCNKRVLTPVCPSRRWILFAIQPAHQQNNTGNQFMNSLPPVPEPKRRMTKTQRALILRLIKKMFGLGKYASEIKTAIANQFHLSPRSVERYITSARREMVARVEIPLEAHRADSFTSIAASLIHPKPASANACTPANASTNSSAPIPSSASNQIPGNQACHQMTSKTCPTKNSKPPTRDSAKTANKNEFTF